jgi:hypothetical protein
MPDFGFIFNLFVVVCGSFIVGMATLLFWVVATNWDSIEEAWVQWRRKQRTGRDEAFEEE